MHGICAACGEMRALHECSKCKAQVCYGCSDDEACFVCFSKPVVSEVEARRLLKAGAATLSIKHPAINAPLIVERIVGGKFEAFYDDVCPSKKAGLYRWDEFTVEQVNLIVYEQGMTAEETQDRITLLKSVAPPKH